MKLLEQIGRHAHMDLVMLTVLSNNERAVRFYERLGFGVDEASPGPCYNLGGSAAYCILSKLLDDKCLREKCAQCAFRCRYADSLEQHAGYAHGAPWPFPCPAEGCGRGTVLAHQLQRHGELLHGLPSPRPASVPPPPPPRAAELVVEGDDVDDAASTDTTARGTELLNDRVEFKANGRKGTVVKIGGGGFFTVRMDGSEYETVVCRVSAFVGYDAVERPKRKVDPDWEFALQLQMEDGWARKSTRRR
jgi:hypothetical protein